MARTKTCKCGGTAHFTSYCAAHICERCGAHVGLARCYCGWTENGNGRGYQELVEMGETIEPEDY